MSCQQEYEAKMKAVQRPSQESKQEIRPETQSTTPKQTAAATTQPSVTSQPLEPRSQILIKPSHTVYTTFFASHTPKHNSVPFTPMQAEAIRSGINPGLTMIVGPPGTGKTDVAVQIISELYHNFPNQRTLLVTHSNHALNDLFEKIMVRIWLKLA